jgi:hypothetical protein
VTEERSEALLRVDPQDLVTRSRGLDAPENQRTGGRLNKTFLPDLRTKYRRNCWHFIPFNRQASPFSELDALKNHFPLQSFTISSNFVLFNSSR